MQLLNHHFQDLASLHAFIEQHELQTARGLIQLFCGHIDSARLTPVLDSLSGLKGFQLIGTSTSGEISDDRVLDGGLLIAFSLFEHTRVETFHVTDLSRDSGRQLGLTLHETDARLLLAFGNPLSESPEPFLEGLSETAPNLVVAGGNAGDNNRFQDTFVICAGEFHSQGIALALLRSDRLQVHSRQVLNWIPVGVEMTVTRCLGNRLYELDGKPVLEVYRYYLGDDIFNTDAGSAMEFPLIVNEGGTSVARSSLGRSDDGALVYAGQLRNGQRVRFGVADINTIRQTVGNLAEQLSRELPVEGVYLYSCAARRTFLRQDIEEEIHALATLGPTAGFFTYGEYFHDRGHNRLLNTAATLVTLSESGEIRPRPIPARTTQAPAQSTLRALTHLINVSSRELVQSQRFLEQYREALEKATIVSKADKFGRITYVNSLFEEISGYSAAEVIGHNHNLLRHPDMPASVFSDLWRTITRKQVWSGTIKNRKKDGGVYYVNSTIVPLLDNNGDIVEYISIRDDVTELIAKERLISQQRTDSLTALPSRNRLLEEMEQEHPSLLALCDVNNFRSINDYYGIPTGDRLIVEIATRLSQSLESSGIRIYRQYGDGFAFLPPADMAIEQFEHWLLVAGSTVEDEPLSAEGELIDVELRFGMAQGDKHLLALTEAALQQAKQGKVPGRILCFNEENQSHLNKQYWIQSIKEAIAEGRVISHFQPISHTRGERRIKYEALLRVVDHSGTPLPPAEFLDIIKYTKYYPELTRRMVDNAIQLTQITPCVVSVNLSAEDLENKETCNFIIDRLRQHGGERLIFEITESESLQDYQQVNEFVREVRRHHARIAIDDFGSGYSNFSYLVEIQPEFIKIDGSIISAILTDQKSLLVTEGIIDLAHRIGAEVIAEFVSSDEIAACLNRIGANYLQGFAIGKPAPLL